MKAIATLLMWLIYMAGLFFMGDFLDLGAWVILLAVVLMLPLIMANMAMWNVFHGHKETDATENISSLEKRKRDRLDAILRDLSDEQLAALKSRLSEPDFEDKVLVMIGDDGELVHGNN
ncbi:MAG: hypothetical protein KC546_18870 [Anaerolineae bacterium]|nr:hypothetical protein [Anaerolineae bacterium]MCA9893964.1 hypothetical protein [Anaerolineae bacterium]MCB9460219.1 hypothetical protein [Anaerolineaceae bacterium]